MKRKKKILVLSDHALSTSGVGTQSRHLINGLLQKYPGEWCFRQFGAAIKHENYDVVQVNEDFVIKPIDGFGDPEMIRLALITEKPDILFIFTDPRFFVWLFEMEDEIHQMCPIVWWHVWDNYPYPDFNTHFYESTDAINCHSHMTYTMIKEKFPEKTNFIPHALPKEVFFPMPKKDTMELKRKALGDDKKDDFVVFWMNRNARRKRTNDVLEAWSIFVKNLEEKHGKRDVTLLMHTDPQDNEGPNLFSTADKFGIQDAVMFSTQRVGFEQINIMHNISDCCLNISYAEGFGLATLESMQCGTPIIAAKTGGLTRQVVDYRDGSHNGVALDIDLKTLVGSQSVPYIYEDYCSNEKVAEAIMKMYEKTPEEKEALSKKVIDYVDSDFSFDKTVELWHESLTNVLDTWEDKRDRKYLGEIK